MKILLATPIYPPEIGGPATYSKKLKDGLEGAGHVVRVVSYGGLKKYPQPLRMLAYFISLLRNTSGCDIIYSFNLVSCGIPSCFCAKITGKRFFVRIGGDFLWERAVESGRTKKPLSEYYSGPASKRDRFWIFLMGKVSSRAEKIIFTSKFQRDIYLKPFGVGDEKTAVIQNPFPDVHGNDQEVVTSSQLIFAGRLIKLKNIDFLIRAFRNITKETSGDLTLKIIGDGPEKNNLDVGGNVVIEPSLPQAELLDEIRRSYLCILPSLTEITPNLALECIKLGKPILLTKETGIYENFKNDLIFIDPRNEKDLEEKMIHLLDKKNYDNYVEKIKNIPTAYSWGDIVEKHINLFKKQ